MHVLSWLNAKYKMPFADGGRCSGILRGYRGMRLRSRAPDQPAVRGLKRCQLLAIEVRRRAVPIAENRLKIFLLGRCELDQCMQ